MIDCSRFPIIVLGVALTGTSVIASDFNLRVTSNGNTAVVATPCGGSVNYEITGLLNDTMNEGLSGFMFELAFTGGPLQPAATPTSGALSSFVSPAGLNGPAGFGGAPAGDGSGRLVLVGGAQNTIKNTAATAPFPVGSVVTGVGHTETVLVTGALIAPSEPGTYTLSVSKLSAAVIKDGEDGSGVVWATEPAAAGTMTPLTVVVPPAAQAATAANSGPVCGSESVTLFGGPNGMTSYSWTGPSGFTSSQQNPTLSPAERGTYTLTVTDGNNCLATARTTVDLLTDLCQPPVDCNANDRADECDIALGQPPSGRAMGSAPSEPRTPSPGPVAPRRPAPHLAWGVLKNASSAQGQPTIVLSPVVSSGPVGSFHTLSAMVSTNGVPVVGASVSFDATSGPHIGVLGTDVSDPDGQAAISYVGANGEGTDQIMASYFDGVATRFSNTVSRAWLGSLDCNFNAVPDECEASGAPAATLLGGASRKLHGGGVGPASIAVNIAGRVQDGNVTSEPRAGGISELRLAFDIAPGGPGADPVAIHQQSCPGGAQSDYQLYAGASTSSASVVGNDLVLTFTPPLANARTYRITVGPAVTGVPCQSIEVRGLVGDSGSDGRVNATDRSFVVGVWTGSGFSANTDIDASGVTNATDRSLVVGAWTGAANCAP